MVGLKQRSKLDSDPEYAKRSLMLETFQTSLTALDFYALARRTLSAPELLAFNKLLRLKYVMMAYTRTQVFKQINFGTPFIRPLFFNYPGATSKDLLGTSYMYGPSILSSNG